MAIYDLKDFLDIVDAVREELGIQSSDTTSINKIKRDINMVYLQEVVPAKRWKWLTGESSVVHKAYYSGGTASMTSNSATVTLSVAPSASAGSFAGYKFAVDGFDEVYTIDSHTAESTTVTLSGNYQGQTAATASFKIWRDKFDLPTDARETYDVWHDRSSSTMKGVSRSEIRRIRAEDPKAEGFPVYYTTGDYYDPTPLTGETEADRYRQVQIYPSIYTEAVTINFEYVIEASPLEDDADEPLMALEDRVVLLYGALARGWTKFQRNPEESTRNYQLFSQKLARMMGEQEDGPEMPTIAPKSRYLNRVRANRLGSLARRGRGFGGESAIGNITYLEGVTINGMTLTGNMTVDAGITIDGRDISADGTTLDSISTLTANIDTANRVVITDSSANLEESAVTSTELTWLDEVEPDADVTITDNTSNFIVNSWAKASFNMIDLHYRSTRGAGNIEVGSLRIMYDSNGDAAYLTQFGLLTVGTLGTTFSVAVSGGNIELRCTTTSTGTAVTFTSKVEKVAV